MTLNIIIVVILLGGWIFGKIFNSLKLPSVLGMVIYGILVSAFFSPYFPDTLKKLEPSLKSIALIVILLRAGLGISKQNLKKTGLTSLLMAFIPCIIEGAALTVLLHLIFNFSWQVSGLTAFMLAAVSPAVIVPSMLDLKSSGYGKRNEVPTIVLAGASVDDVFAITIFSVFLRLSTSNSVSIGKAVLSIPISIVLGIVPGVIIGFLLVYYFNRKKGKIRATEKILILLTITILSVQIGNWLHSAALLGVMTIGFIILEKSENVAHQLANKLSKVWIFAEIVLFVLIGLSVDIKVAFNAGFKGILIISIGLIFRSLGVLIATAFSKLNVKEKIFCVIAYLPKATVQAALGSVALHNGIKEGEIILAIAVLSIIFTAPIGLIGIKLFGHRLLDFDFPKKEKI